MIRRLSICTALLALAAIAIPAAALGAANHPFLQAISATGTFGSPYGGFEGACGVAFNPAGSLYVSDYYHDAIESFDSAAKYQSQIAKEDPGDGPCKLGFDTAGNLYVNNWHRDVLKYTQPFGTGAVIDSKEPTGLAVDPATGDLYVAHRTYVSLYEAPVQAGDLPAKTIGLDPAAEYFGVAVSDFPATAGDVYLPDASTNTVKVFDPAGTLIETIDGEATPQGAFKYLTDGEVAVDNSPTSPSYGHIFVLDAIGAGKSEHPEALLDEFNAQGDYRGQVTGFTDAEPSGIAFQEGSHNVYVSSGNTEGSAVFAYGPTSPAKSLKVTKSGAGEGTVTSLPAGIACGAACAAEYNEGQTVTLFAAPDAHSVLAGWSGAGCSGTGTCTVLLSHDVEVSASFEEPAQQTLTATVSGEGTVVSEPTAISCPPTCSAHFNQGRLVTLSAEAAPHNEFLAWSGCDSQPSPTQCKVTMSAAKALSAEFAPIPQKTLTLARTGAGQGTLTSQPAGISCPPTCSAPFDQDSTVALGAAPAPGSTFAGWSGAGCSGSGVCEVAMSEAESLSAEFTIPSPASVKIPGGEGPIVSSPAPSVPPPPAQVEKFTLGSAISSLSGTAVRIAATLPGPGTLTASGEGLKPSSAMSHAPGPVSLRLALSGGGQKALHKAADHRLAVKVTFAFTPSAGAPSSATKTVTFGALSATDDKGQAALSQRGDLFAAFGGGIFPAALPRRRLAPISVSVSGTVKSLSGSEPPPLRGIAIAVNRAGHLDTRGLPICPRSKLQATSDKQALSACGDALVGRGSYVAATAFPEQGGFPSQGTILAFNSLLGGRPVILAHVYGAEPIPSARIVVFHLRHLKGTYGTVLSGALPPTLNRYGYLKSIDLQLHRLFDYHGATHSYLSASCPAPKGFSAAVFPLARTSMSFADGRTLASTLIRSCKVSE